MNGQRFQGLELEIRTFHAGQPSEAVRYQTGNGSNWA